ncbi:DNA-binding protein [Fibrisoma montanum]|uniref:DNA-binding protein n=1 Tax=Fibrisoma montanum TaxID=2305895 RepID=A0A418M173_9BACT|nr:helix-turn-helix domain-containing protein [Fibrisoma montanum]RIV19417.1 DNA-binding protein [Fibrisoma montanum]
MFTENPFAAIWQRLDQIEARQNETLQLLRSNSTNSATTDETPVTTDEAARQFGIAKQTLYQNAKKIKHIKRFGRLYFYPSDLRDYLDAGAR